MIRIEDVTKWKKDLKVIHPEDPEYYNYWYEEKRRIIEGYWDREGKGWRYMPGKLYFFVNHSVLIDFDEHRTMHIIIPELWDLHWMYGYISLVSLGFSGFADDPKYTCDKRIFEIKKGLLDVPIELLRPDGKFKEFIEPLDYAMMIHDDNYGLPLYNNELFGYNIFGSRGGGKSYWMANGELLHEIVTDGIRYYLPEYREKKPKVRVLIGSGDAAKSSETCSKIKLTMDELALNKKLGVFGAPGEEFYMPSPLYKDMRGSIGPNNKENPWRHEYEVLSKGRKIIKGSKSELHHVNYSEMKSKGRGAQAGAGGRYSITLVEEVGLCFAKGTKVRMFDLSIKNIEDIVDGDLVMGADGKPRTVCNTNKGEDLLYKVKQLYGDDYIVNSEHPLVLFERYKNRNNDIIVKAKDFNSLSKSRKKALYGVKASEFYFDDIDLEIDPYYLGCWIGDGESATQSVFVNISSDPEILDFINNYAKELNMKVSVSWKNTVHKASIINADSSKTNKLKQLLKSNNLLNNKHIPVSYLKSGIMSRFKILAGIIDTDGCLMNKGKTNQAYEISISKNKELADNVVFLAKSLGLKATLKTMFSNKGYGDTIIPYRYKYKVMISGKIWNIPVLVERKKAVKIDHKKNHLLSSICVEEIGRGDYYGFTLKEDPYFVLEDNTIVHNTPLIREAYASNDATVRIGTNYIGRQLMIGTSENIEIVGPAQNIFENPRDYRMIPFPNEETGMGETGFFLSAYYTDKKFKDKNGNTDFEQAKIFYDKIRVEKSKSDNPEILRKEKMNYPIKISEMWLTDQGYYLPYEEAKVREQQLMVNNLYKDIATNVVLSWNPESERGVSYEIDYNASPIDTWPVPADAKDQSGCIQIFEFPTPLANGEIPNDMYNCIGYDMYVEEDINKGGSLGVTIVLKNPKYITKGFTGNNIVAMYVGKPIKGMDYYHEQQEKLLAMYGNPLWGLMFEKNRGEACREYYIRKSKLNILAPTPQMRQGNSMYQRNITSFGFLVGNRISKLNILKMTRDWLLEETEYMVNGKSEKLMNVFRIPSLFLIRQIMTYSLDGNFDGVSALMGCVVALREWETIEEEKIKINSNRPNIFEKYLPNKNNRNDTFKSKKERRKMV